MNKIIYFFKNLTIGKKILLFLSPVISIVVSMKLILIGLAILIVVDLVTGIRKNNHKNKIPFNPLKLSFWKSIKSYLLRKTWVKTYEYIIGIVAFIVLESYVIGITNVEILNKTFSLSELAAIIPAGVEIWSIFENLESVSGNNLLKKCTSFISKKLFKK